MFIKLLSPKILYLTFTRDCLYLRCPASLYEHQINPTIAVDSKGKLITIGNESEIQKVKNQEGVKIRNGFNHPRLCISDFEAAEAAIRYLIYESFKLQTMLRPVIIMHPLEKLEGGITSVEIKSLKEVCMASGAKEAHVWVGRKLMDAEINTLSFPLNEGQKY